jgi:cobalt-zinc-cadmium efflux system outer membrane protein
MKNLRRLLWVFLLAGLAGCQNPMHSAALTGLEADYQELAARRDLDRSADMMLAAKPRAAVNAEQPRIGTTMDNSSPLSPALGGEGLGVRGRFTGSRNDQSIQLVTAFQEGDKELPKKRQKITLTIPPQIPGSDAPPIDVPKTQADLETMIQKLYPPLPPLDAPLVLAPGPEGRPLSLADLQRLAEKYSPAIRAAEAAVVATRGALRQSMAYPNPSIFYETDTAGTGQAGYQGFGIDQVIKTANKLQLQGAAATMDYRNAQLALRKARFDVAYQVRTNYFAVLVALENVKVSRAFAEFTDRIFVIQVRLLRGNEAAAYEPMQLRPLALRARFNHLQALNQYRASWRQLAVSLGLPDMPPSEVAGQVDFPVPQFDHQQVLDQIMNRHTDVLTALNNIHKTDYQLQLVKVQPIPDVDVHVLVQKDYTTPPFYTVPSVSVTVPLPVWDRNQGAIQQAQALLAQAEHNLPVARNTLTNSLADAFNRYQTNKDQVNITQAQLKDQVRVYRAVYNRFRGGDPAVTFGDVVTAQQTLAGYLTSYIAALGLQWQAVVDVANLLQTDDLFLGSTGLVDPDAPSLEHLESLFQCPQVGSTADGSAATIVPASLGLPRLSPAGAADRAEKN